VTLGHRALLGDYCLFRAHEGLVVLATDKRFDAVEGDVVVICRGGLFMK
jgi:hypothetical protein